MANFFDQFDVSANGNFFDQFDASKPKDGVAAGDIAKSGGIGLVKSGIGLAGLPGDLSELGARGLDVATRFVGNKLGYDIPERPNLEASGGAGQIQRGLESITGPLYEPQTTAGHYAQTIGEFAPAAIGGPGGIATKIGARVVAPAVASEAAGQLSQGTQAEPYARAAGALLGGLAQPLSARAITPLPISPQRQAMVDALKNEGVTALTAGQVSGRKGLQYLESSLSDLPMAGGAASKIAEDQAKQFTSAALKRMGVNAELAAPDVVDAGVKAIGQKFDVLSARNSMRIDPRLNADLAAAKRDYDSLTIPSQRAPIVEKIVTDIQALPAMPGTQYQSVRSQLTKQAESLKLSNTPLSNALRDIRKSLDSAMNRSISPADRGLWAEARREWGNWKTLAKSNISGEGIISPATLKQAARSGNQTGYARGQGDFNELARSGSEIMKPLPQSGTAPRTYAQNFFPTLLAGAGGGAGLGGLPGMLAGIAAVSTPPIGGRLLMSGPVQRYLKNQVMTGAPGGNAFEDALLRAVLAAPQRGALAQQ